MVSSRALKVRLGELFGELVLGIFILSVVYLILSAIAFFGFYMPGWSIVEWNFEDRQA